MDCPNCGVYNPEDRQVCWRCDHELPKPKEPKKRKSDPGQAMRRMWIIVVIVLVVWIVISWLLPMLMGGAPGP
jgi:predicted nucleic acid-binding Zn ribbon protein